MAKRIVTTLIVILVLGACALSILCSSVSGDPALRQTDLRLNDLPLPPAQPVTASLACSHGLVVKAEVTGEFYLVRDHPPCTVGLDLMNDLEMTAAEMLVLRRRPQVAFKVPERGRVTSAYVIGSSGIRTLDDKAVKLILAHTFPRHNCGVCTVSTQVNVRFRGPVWVHE